MIPIVLLHGALGASNQFKLLKSKLEGEGNIVYAIDFSGHHGKPFHPNGFGIEIFASDVLQFLDLHGIKCADIFGYSMGGYVALWLAHIKPERVGRIVTLGTKFDWSVESAAREVRKMDPEKIESKVPAFARVLENRHKPVDWKVLVHKTAEMMTDLGNKPLLSEKILRTIITPTSIYLGDRDDMADRSYSERVATLLPSASFNLLENTAHPIESVSFVPFRKL